MVGVSALVAASPLAFGLLKAVGGAYLVWMGVQAWRHAGQVSLREAVDGVHLQVRDNGKGGDLEREDARIKGLGLTSMQERTRIMGGFLRAHSFQREGTKVCVWVPYSREGA